MEKAIVVVTNKKQSSEFLTLVKEAGYEIEGILYVKNITSNILSDYKLEQLKRMVNANREVSKVIFDQELRPRQAYRIAKETSLEPLDRIQVILKIFLAHAPSLEAKLQIKLASLRYELARAKEKVRLAKMSELPGFSGLGTYKVDVYYNEIKNRISKIHERISKIRRRRQIHRVMRLKRGIKTISITGYTCSGKTTLFNLLTNSFEKVGREPFTTLSTKFKLVRIGPWKVYLSDTIGFISNLPPFMIHAFRSTLEEISSSDLVILMLDGSDPLEIVKEKFKTSFNLLIDLGVINRPIITVVNKIDLIDEEKKLENIDKYLLNYTPYIVNISAKQGINADKLVSLIENLLGMVKKIEVTLPYTQDIYYTIDFIKEKGKVLGLREDKDKLVVEVVIPEVFTKLIERRIQKVKGLLKVKS